MKVNGKCTAQRNMKRMRKQQHERGLFVVCSFAAVMSGTITLPAARHISSCVFVSTIPFETKIIDGKSRAKRRRYCYLKSKIKQQHRQTQIKATEYAR